MTDSKPPRVSIVMGVYNCAETLPETLSAIANQSESSWELVVCNDGSTDATQTILDDFYGAHREKVKLLRNSENLGLAVTLNRCVSASRSEYLARMDGDDSCAPGRLRIQADYLDQHPEISFVSSAIALFDEHGTWAFTTPPLKPELAHFVRGNPYAHGATMARKSHLGQVGFYSESSARWRVEDYDLWLRLHLSGHVGVNLEAPLYFLRDDRDAASRRSLRARINEARVILRAGRAAEMPFLGLLHASKVVFLGLLPVAVYRLVRRNWRKKNSHA